MKKIGLLTTSILLTLSLAMYSRYFSDSVANSQHPRLIRVSQQIALKRRLKRSLNFFRSQISLTR
ncbi:hypothetical protein [Gloeothece citriformis]|uniref:hypothetical protein n=1 Tax=Gloeothece citriformis TaxID=2546356 RepID=UPI0012FF16A8|nr:hypothetical protein [Gloeothece citriformis]